MIPTTVFSSVRSSGYRRAPFWRYDTLLIVAVEMSGSFCPGVEAVARMDCPFVTVIDKCGQATKGVWWMPWHREATKDVVACDKLREAGKRASIRRFLNEETLLHDLQ